MDYPVQTTGDFIDQNLNKGEPVPSILLDQLIQTVETKKQFIDISYHLWRFRHSPFSYKMRPWTNYFLITKGSKTVFSNLKLVLGVRLGAFEALVELLLKSETYGSFPDAASLSYLLLNLVENGENQLAVEACVDLLIKDLCSSSTLAKVCLNIFINNIGKSFVFHNSFIFNKKIFNPAKQSKFMLPSESSETSSTTKNYKISALVESPRLFLKKK